MDQEILELFRDAFRAGHGSDCITCTCGITHFNSVDTLWCESELEWEKINAEALANPSKYVSSDGGASMLNLGPEYVIGCPCKTEERYAEWIWQHRHRVTEYLTGRAKHEFKLAEASLRTVSKLA